MKHPGKLLIALLTVAALGCRTEEARTPRAEADRHPPSAPRSASSDIASSPRHEPRAGPAAAPWVESAGLPHEAAGAPAWLGAVGVDLRRFCGVAGQLESNGKRLAWLKQPKVQRAVYALADALRPYEESLIGTFADNRKKRLVVIMHTDFEEYAAVQRAVAGKVKSQEVVLAPGCHTRGEIAEADRVLLEQAWHPAAKAAPMAFTLDPAFSGYDVVVDESAPEVAVALKQRLGALVHVSLGKPRRF